MPGVGVEGWGVGVSRDLTVALTDTKYDRAPTTQQARPAVIGLCHAAWPEDEKWMQEARGMSHTAREEISGQGHRERGQTSMQRERGQWWS